MTLVSLVMPVWRPRTDWLTTAVTSALAEECDVELILVDDGNDVPVRSPVDDRRVRVVRATHRGPYAARDVGLAHARGSHVRFVDADDEVIAGSTTTLLRASEAERGAIAHGVTEVCDESLRPTGTVGSRLRGDVVDACLLGRFTVFHVSLLYPRAVVEAAGPWEVPAFRVSGDWDYVLRAVEHAPVVPVERVVTRYRRHPTSVMSSARIVDGGRARAMIIERHLERLPERRGGPIERRALGEMHLSQATSHAWRGERVPALRELVRATRHRPVGAAVVAARLGTERVRLAVRARGDRTDGGATRRG